MAVVVVVVVAAAVAALAVELASRVSIGPRAAVVAGTTTTTPVSTSTSVLEYEAGPLWYARPPVTPLPPAEPVEPPRVRGSEGAGSTRGVGLPPRVEFASRQELWDALADCESGDWGRDGRPVPGSRRWHVADSLHSGGLQFAYSTWAGFAPAGFPASAHEATPEQQVQVAELVAAAQGWGAWPVCSRKVGLR